MNDLTQLSKAFQWFAIRRIETIKKDGEIVIVGKSRLGRSGKIGPKNGGGPTPTRSLNRQV